MIQRLVFATLVCAAGSVAAQNNAPAQSSAAPGAGAALDFEFFKERVQPILTTKRDGNARCVSCHGFGTPMRLQPLPDGAATWSEEDARKNFELMSARVDAGQAGDSRLLRHPLAEEAGGDPHHDGGKHWTSKDDPEWQTLAAWAKGVTLQRERHRPRGTRRIIQTNSAGDDVHIIDPATNKVVGQDRRDRGGSRRGRSARRQPYLREQRSE